MSSILKALKKLEEEKSVRPGVNPDISRGILRAGRKGAKRPPWLLPAAGMAGAALVAVLATYVAMGGFSRKQTQSAINTPSALKEEPILPQPPPVAGGAATLTASRPAPGPRPSPSRREAPHAQVKTKPEPPPVHTSAPAVRPLTIPVAPNLHPSAEPSPAPQPVLRVSGIAWRQDGSSRVAIINGQSVAEGGMVGGARVEEIDRDRVRFSSGGRGFDVSLEK